MATGRLRVMRCEMGFVSRGDGSCSFSAGKSVVWASMNGPGDSHPSRRHGDQLYIESCYRSACGDTEESPFNGLLRTALEHTINVKLFPRAAIQVTVHEMQPQGSMCALALTAAGMTVLDGAVPTRAPFCGVQVVRVKGELIVDPDAATEAKADTIFNFAISTDRAESASIGLANQPTVIGMEAHGAFTAKDLLLARNLAIEAAKEIFMFFKETLQRKYTVESIA